MCPFNDKIMSSSSLELMSSIAFLMKAHNCATFTISLDSSNGRERHSHASINFHSCSSTAFPSRCLVEVFWVSCPFYGLHGLPFIVEVFKKAICCFEKGFLHNIAIFEWLLVFSKGVTDVIGSNSCGLTLVPGLMKIDCRAASCAVKARLFVARKGVLAGKSLW